METMPKYTESNVRTMLCPQKNVRNVRLMSKCTEFKVCIQTIISTKRLIECSEHANDAQIYWIKCSNTIWCPQKHESNVRNVPMMPDSWIHWIQMFVRIQKPQVVKDAEKCRLGRLLNIFWDMTNDIRLAEMWDSCHSAFINKHSAALTHTLSPFKEYDYVDLNQEPHGRLAVTPFDYQSYWWPKSLNWSKTSDAPLM